MENEFQDVFLGDHFSLTKMKWPSVLNLLKLYCSKPPAKTLLCGKRDHFNNREIMNQDNTKPLEQKIPEAKTSTRVLSMKYVTQHLKGYIYFCTEFKR